MDDVMGKRVNGAYRYYEKGAAEPFTGSMQIY